MNGFSFHHKAVALSSIVFTVAAMLAAAAPIAADGAKAKRSEQQLRGKHNLAKGPVGQPSQAPERLARPANTPPLNTTAGVPGEVVDPVHMKILVLTATADDLTLPAIKQALDYLGTPYEVMVTAPVPTDPSTNRLASKLSDLPLDTAINGFYQGIILTTGNLTYSPDGSSFFSGLNAAEWASLWAYEAKFSIRQVTWYTFPTQDYGFTGSPSAIDTTTSPLDVPFTAAGREVFGSYLKTTTPLPIRNAYTYLDRPLDAATTPLLSDAAGNALAAVRTYPDGRQNLALTFSSNQYLLHNLLVSYGLVNWVTRGLFVGERHVYMTPQLDDLLIADSTWPASTPCSTSLEDPSLPEYRMTGPDFQRVIQWQKGIRAQPTTSNFRSSFAFNGVGSTTAYYNEYRAATPTAPATDTLTPAVRNDNNFFYINHTYTHANLDSISSAEATNELTENHKVAAAGGLGLRRYSRGNLVTPDISGLANPAFLQSAYTFGTRNLVSDTSRGGTSDNPSPNTGVYNSVEPRIFQIPRRPVNLYFSVTSPAEWLALDNCIYPVGAFGHVDTYDQLLDREANVLLTYLLKGDIDPLMFHQPNLRAYDGVNSTFTDLMGRTLAKYNTYFTLPMESLAQDVIARKMIDRAQFNASGVTATFVPGAPGQGPKSITLTAPRAATVPVTGLGAAGSEVYGGQRITYVKLAAGQSITYTPAVSLNPTSVDFGTQLVGNSSTRTVTLTNTGALALAITRITTTGSSVFSQTNNCGSSVGPQAKCTITVRYRPSRSLSSDSGTLTIDTNAPNSPHNVPLKGSALL